ncbi:TPA: IS1 family transposase [Pseudomonas aeruginosa]|nr:IS1 family transposase [Pseudomonas aeruginosa]
MGKKSSQGQEVESADTTKAQNSLSDADGAKAARKKRSPAAHQGIQVNFCKNPICANFGSPVGDKLSRSQNPYRIVASGKGLPVGYCQSCTESFPLKSNKGIHEELERMLAFLVDSPVQSCCPVEDCSNHAVPVSSGKVFYSSFGTTCSGSQRYLCKGTVAGKPCKKTFSITSKSTRRQRLTHKNKSVFKLIVNKVPVRRIAEIEEIALQTVYDKIDFIHRQCLAFASERESKLPDMPIRRLYISVDRQDYVINWSRRDDRRNTVVSAVASADNTSQYIFAMHLNFDPRLDPEAIEEDAKLIADISLPTPHRKYARLWMASDYLASMAASKKSKASGSLEGDIAATYSSSEKREDVEISDEPTKDEKLPDRGMQTHSEYTLYGHFLYLRHLLASVEKLRFFLDQDSGMRAACLAAFQDGIKSRRVDAFYVRINKMMTVDQKRRLINESNRAIAKVMKENPTLNKREAVLMLLRQRIEQAKLIGKWRDRWVFHPLATMNEPEKALCHLTDLGDLEPDHAAWLYNRASLHGVDSYFNRVRRRQSLLERSISSQSNTGRVWSGYAPYSPNQVQKLLDILRVVQNYVLKSGKDKKTPAMRLGLAKGPVKYEDILYFTEP